MQVLAENNATDLLGGLDLGSFIAAVDWQYPDPVPHYLLPKDSGEKVALARVISNTLLDRGPFLLWITETGIWSSAEHLDLFTRYRLSFGERRSLSEAPVHLLEPGDQDTAISLICLSLFFVWGFEIVTYDRSIAISVSHDEWVEVRNGKGYEDIAKEIRYQIDRVLRR